MTGWKALETVESGGPDPLPRAILERDTPPHSPQGLSARAVSRSRARVSAWGGAGEGREEGGPGRSAAGWAGGGCARRALAVWILREPRGAQPS